MCFISMATSEHFTGRPSAGWQWLGVIVCGISYYMGITRALFLITPPVTRLKSCEKSHFGLCFLG